MGKPKSYLHKLRSGAFNPSIPRSVGREIEGNYRKYVGVGFTDLFANQPIQMIRINTNDAFRWESIVKGFYVRHVIMKVNAIGHPFYL